MAPNSIDSTQPSPIIVAFSPNEINNAGRLYKLENQCHCQGLRWRIDQFIKAFIATAFTLGFALISTVVREYWKNAWTGKKAVVVAIPYEIPKKIVSLGSSKIEIFSIEPVAPIPEHVDLSHSIPTTKANIDKLFVGDTMKTITLPCPCKPDDFAKIEGSLNWIQTLQYIKEKKKDIAIRIADPDGYAFQHLDAVESKLYFRIVYEQDPNLALKLLETAGGSNEKLIQDKLDSIFDDFECNDIAFHFLAYDRSTARYVEKLTDVVKKLVKIPDKKKRVKLLQKMSEKMREDFLTMVSKAESDPIRLGILSATFKNTLGSQNSDDEKIRILIGILDELSNKEMDEYSQFGSEFAEVCETKDIRFVVDVFGKYKAPYNQIMIREFLNCILKSYCESELQIRIEVWSSLFNGVWDFIGNDSVPGNKFKGLKTGLPISITLEQLPYFFETVIHSKLSRNSKNVIVEDVIFARSSETGKVVFFKCAGTKSDFYKALSAAKLEETVYKNLAKKVEHSKRV